MYDYEESIVYNELPLTEAFVPTKLCIEKVN